MKAGFNLLQLNRVGTYKHNQKIKLDKTASFSIRMFELGKA